MCIRDRVQGDRGGNAVDLCKVSLYHTEGLFTVEEALLEDAEHLACTQLLVAVVGHALDLVAQSLAHLGGQVVAVVLLQHKADAALAALAVDTDDVGVIGKMCIRDRSFRFRLTGKTIRS